MKFKALAALAYLAVISVFCIGWLLNLMHVIESNETIATMSVIGGLKILGIFVAPLGGILGWLA